MINTAILTQEEIKAINDIVETARKREQDRQNSFSSSNSKDSGKLVSFRSTWPVVRIVNLFSRSLIPICFRTRSWNLWQTLTTESLHWRQRTRSSTSNISSQVNSRSQPVCFLKLLVIFLMRRVLHHKRPVSFHKLPASYLRRVLLRHRLRPFNKTWSLSTRPLLWDQDSTRSVTILS